MASLSSLNVLLSGYLGHRCPDDVKNVCIAYLFVEESFESVGDLIQIDDTNKNIASICRPAIWNMLYGKTIIDSQWLEYRWRFKILRKWGRISIGIVEKDAESKKFQIHSRKKLKYYALQSSGEVYGSKQRSNVGGFYAYTQGDVVEMVVKNSYIEFFVNDEPCVGMKILSKGKNYRMAVSLVAYNNGNCTSIELLKQND